MIRSLIVSAALLGLCDVARADGAAHFVDVTESHLPKGDLDGLIMDAKPVDVDGDGDPDLVLAHEFRPNIILINDGAGRFANESAARLNAKRHDSEDVGAADFDSDGDPDLIIVTEDDKTNEYHRNRGDGHFDDISDSFPVRGVSNGLWVADYDGDGDADVAIANNGQNALLINHDGVLTDETDRRLPAVNDVSQDIEAGDVDGDGDLDLLVGNEGRNRLLINDGTGRFADESAARLPEVDTPGETREADFGDIDGDGDLDIFAANTRFFMPGAPLANQLWRNEGDGTFTDISGMLPPGDDLTVDGDFADIDEDGDLDLLTAGVKRLRGESGKAPLRLFLNDGGGRFTEATRYMLPESARAHGLDVEVADFNGDGVPDIYLASRGSADRLFFGRAEKAASRSRPDGNEKEGK